MTDTHRWIPLIAALAVLTGAGPARAARLNDKLAPAPATVRSSTPSAAAAASTADDSSSMREGVITGIGPQHDRIEINGSWLKLPPTGVQVFRDGSVATRATLVKGEHVRFILLPGGTDRATLRAVYVP